MRLLGAAPVDSYGVGTRLITGSGVPTAALVYKLVSRENREGTMVGVAKKSASKNTVAGKKYAGRLYDEDGYASEEVLVTGSAEEAAAFFEENGARPCRFHSLLTARSWRRAGALRLWLRHRLVICARAMNCLTRHGASPKANPLFQRVTSKDSALFAAVGLR